jgi:hypothetical protein
MSTKSVIADIKKTRSVVEAQVGRLGEVSPHPVKIPPTTGDTTTATAKIINSVLTAQLGTAADCLHALTNVEADIRTPPKPAEKSAESATVDLDPADYKEVSP